MLLDIKLS